MNKNKKPPSDETFIMQMKLIDLIFKQRTKFTFKNPSFK